MTTSGATIGFVGVGIMGRPMAGHLLRAGFSVVACDMNEEAIVGIVEQGARRADSPREVAERSDHLITMLPDSPEVKAVALGAHGLIEGVSAGMIYADMSTIAPTAAVEVARALGEKGVECLDAPVSGGEVGAEQATLSIMAGGEQAVFDAFMPVFEKLGKTITLCGPAGAGQTVKACNQIQVALNFIGMSEALVLGTKAGVDPEVIVKVLSGGYAQTRVMDVRGPRVVKGDFEPGFRSRFHYKDLNIIMKTALDFGVPLPATAVAHELFTAMQARDRGDLDHSGVITVLEDLAGIKARTRA
jgi:2-hydroxy-3-oxopropionate reductase